MSEGEFIARIDRSPRGWYGNVIFEIRLLYGYVESVEHQIDESINRLHRAKQTEIIEYEDGSASIITSYHGIDDFTYHLDTIFKEYFPNLQRRSALITLFSFFEHQLDDLCIRFSNIGKVAVKFDVFQCKDTGIDRSTKYIKEVVGLTLDHGRGPWNEIKNIQSIRNILVHNDGKLKDEDKDKDKVTKKDKVNEATKKYACKHGLLSLLPGECEGTYEIGEEIKINEAYLPHVISTFAHYFKEIDQLISHPNK